METITTREGTHNVHTLPNGYRTYHVAGAIYYVHRTVWEQYNGPIPAGYEVDHINRDRSNNHIGNLRLASKSDNRCNVGLRADNTSGIKGVYPRVIHGKQYWYAQIQKQGKRLTKSAVDKSAVVSWLNQQRDELHGAFQCRG